MPVQLFTWNIVLIWTWLYIYFLKQWFYRRGGRKGSGVCVCALARIHTQIYIGEVEEKTQVDLGVFVWTVCGATHTVTTRVCVYTCSVVRGRTHPICSMIYGSTRATHFNQLAKILTGYEITGARSSSVFMRISFIVVGFLFKITAIPFWVVVGWKTAYRLQGCILKGIVIIPNILSFFTRTIDILVLLI